MAKKYSDLLLFISEAKRLQTEDEKFKHAIEKVKARALNEIRKSKCEVEYNEKVQDAKIENASVDKDGNILRDGESYRFTKEAEKKCVKEIRELTKKLQETIIEIEPYFATSIPELTESQTMAFSGLVIQENNVVKEIDLTNQN